MDGLPFTVGDNIIHVKDPFKEIHIVECMTKADPNDGSPRFIIQSTTTGEKMTLIVSRVGLAGWKKA